MFDRVDEAMTECMNDERCTKVVDFDCVGDIFFLCSEVSIDISGTPNPDQKQCLYIKPGTFLLTIIQSVNIM